MDSKTLALIITLVLAANMTMNTSQTSSWESFKSTHGKTYSSEEEHSLRQAIFMVNEAMINAHNADNTQTYKMGINKFTDLTQEEFKSIYLGYKSSGKRTVAVDDSTTMVGDVDWVSQGAVQSVKDQGQCGSCWAFSAVASAESAKFLSTGVIGNFSEQQLVSCDYNDSGCNGGLMDTAFEYFIGAGICTESSYPYTSGSGSSGSCQSSSCTKDSFTISNYVDVSGTSNLQSACNSRPVSVAVDANNWSYYSSGIFSNCGSSLDHGVLLAGYNSSYWLIKNSWGSSWGESGYIRLAPGNTCGLANEPSYPTA